MKVDHSSAAQSAKQNESAQSSKRSERATDIKEIKDSKKLGTGSSSSASSTISDRAKEMAFAKDVAMSTNEIREEKIAELKRRIAEREYNVKPEAIADRMIEEHLESSGLG